MEHSVQRISLETISLIVVHERRWFKFLIFLLLGVPILINKVSDCVAESMIGSFYKRNKHLLQILFPSVRHRVFARQRKIDWFACTVTARRVALIVSISPADEWCTHSLVLEHFFTNTPFDRNRVAVELLRTPPRAVRLGAARWLCPRKGDVIKIIIFERRRGSDVSNVCRLH